MVWYAVMIQFFSGYVICTTAWPVLSFSTASCTAFFFFFHFLFFSWLLFFITCMARLGGNSPFFFLFLFSCLFFLLLFPSSLPIPHSLIIFFSHSCVDICYFLHLSLSLVLPHIFSITFCLLFCTRLSPLDKLSTKVTLGEGNIKGATALICSKVD